jgi:hypothetical protein
LPITIYFTWQYVPILIFVVYGVLLQTSDFKVKRLGPFYQLLMNIGATARESLNRDYLTFMGWLVPPRALHHKQCAVIYSSLGTLIANSLVLVPQAASIIMYPPKNGRKIDGWKAIRVLRLRQEPSRQV